MILKVEVKNCIQFHILSVKPKIHFLLKLLVLLQEFQHRTSKNGIAKLFHRLIY